MKISIVGIDSKSSEYQIINSSLSSSKVTLLFDEYNDQKDNIDFYLYVFNSSDVSLRSIFHAVNYSNLFKDKFNLVTCLGQTNSCFTEHQKKSLTAIGKMIKLNGGNWFSDINSAIDSINGLISIKR